jgi:murein DD-endopeptidase MepM/ murein hydrolase activator NlpD
MASALVLALVLAQSGPSLSQGRANVQLLRSGDVVRAWKKSLGDVPGQQFTSAAALQRFAAGVRSYGAESKLVSEGLAMREDGTFTYTRVAAVANWARGFTLEITMDSRGRMIAAAMSFPNREAPTTYGAYKPLVKLRLPLDDTWAVLWGGRTWEDNRHASVSDMRFALDLLQRDQKNVSSARGKGLVNEDYFAWNQPVVAPAEGVVVVADDGVADNVPNRAPGGNLYGNLLVIDHGTGEFTLLGHLKQGSLLVKAGDRVVKGQRIARVGNSGMSTEPHLHFQLMDTGDWRTANGLPLVLVDFVRNGTLVEKGEPRRGDLITAVSAEAHR